MGMLHLVRHGQASFGAADYDRLSELGARQCEALGAWFAARGIRFQAVLRGELRRHAQSLAAFTAGYGELPPALVLPGLNEYDGEGLVRALLPEGDGDVKTREGYKRHFRVLRDALAQWMAGTLQPPGVPAHADWHAGVVGALELVRERHDGDVLVVSSGGTISTAIAHVLGAPRPTAIELNMQMRNSALSQLQFGPRGHALATFNHLPHLDAPERAGWITYT
jgi:broad specificity phosphatase PhoE